MSLDGIIAAINLKISICRNAHRNLRELAQSTFFITQRNWEPPLPQDYEE
jgi:hypothetical protein